MKIKQVVFAQATSIPDRDSMRVESSITFTDPKWRNKLLATDHGHFIDVQYEGNGDISRIYATNIKYMKWSHDEQQASQETTTVSESSKGTPSSLSNKPTGKRQNSNVTAS